MEFAIDHTADDWSDWQGRNFAVDDGAVTVAEEPLLDYLPAEPLVAEPPADLDPVDLALDDCGVLHVLDDAGDVYRYDRRHDAMRRLPCTWHADGPGEPSALCVTRASIFVADRAKGRVQAFARRLHQTRWVASAGLDAPVGLAEAGGTVHVLDAGPADADGRLLALAGDGSVEPVATGLADPVALVADGEGRLHALLAGAGGDGDGVGGGDGDSGGGEDEGGVGGDDGDGGSGGDGDAAPDEVVRFDEDGAVAARTALPGALAGDCLAVGPAGELLVGVASSPGVYRHRPGGEGFEPVGGFDRPCSALQFGRAGPDGEVERLFAVGPADEKSGATGDASGPVDGDSGATGDAPGPAGGESGPAGGNAGATDEDSGADDGDRCYALATDRRRSRDDETGRYEATLLRRIDAGERGTRWHRVTLDRQLDGAGTQVRLRYHATDDGDVAYDDEPLRLEAVDGVGPTYAGRLRAAGVEDAEDLVAASPERLAGIASPDAFDLPASTAEGWQADARSLLAASDDVRGVAWQSVAAPDPKDALLDDAVGRYLWVEVTLVGDPHSTPRVDSFRAYFPRQSYLRHLPAIYREDEESAAFLERFLSIFESVFADVEEGIEHAGRYLDPDGVPAEYLGWLEGWLALDPGETWPEPARRELLRTAPSLFRKRGTRDGLLEMIRIYLRHVDVEPPANRELPALPAGGADGDSAGEPAAGEAADDATEDRSREEPRAGEESLVYLLAHRDLDCIDEEGARDAYEQVVPCPQCYVVLLRSFLDDEAVRTVEGVVESEQPAHAVGRTVRLQPWIELGSNSYLGVNTTLPERDFTLDESGLGRDSKLVEREEYGHLELKSRLGTDTIIS